MGLTSRNSEKNYFTARSYCDIITGNTEKPRFGAARVLSGTKRKPSLPAQPPCPERERKMQKILNLQDSFLNSTRKDKTPVTVFLVNGFQLRGTVRGFDSFVVILDSEGKQQMIYKHAISTMVPARPVELGT